MLQSSLDLLYPSKRTTKKDLHAFLTKNLLKQQQLVHYFHRFCILAMGIARKDLKFFKRQRKNILISDGLSA